MTWPVVPISIASPQPQLRGTNFNDAKNFVPYAKVSTGLFNVSTATGPVTAAANTITFFNNIDNDGVSVNSNFTAATPKQILSVSGDGEVNYVVGPVAITAGETTTFSFANDSSTRSMTVTLASGERAVIASAGNPSGSFFQVTSLFGMQIGAINAAKTFYTSTTNHVLVSLTSAKAIGIGSLEFANSCVISITHSANVTATANMERLCGVSYREYL